MTVLQVIHPVATPVAVATLALEPNAISVERLGISLVTAPLRLEMINLMAMEAVVGKAVRVAADRRVTPAVVSATCRATALKVRNATTVGKLDICLAIALVNKIVSVTSAKSPATL